MGYGLWTKERIVTMRINKSTAYFLGIVLLIMSGIFAISSSSESLSGKTIYGNGEVQKVKLYVQNGRYILEPGVLKKDILVRLEADVSRMPGCSKSIVIPEFGVSKIFSVNGNTVEFMPKKAGKFNIACSMNMYKGSFEVLEPDGSKSEYVQQQASPSAGSCGGSGGCGCGGGV